MQTKRINRLGAVDQTPVDTIHTHSLASLSKGTASGPIGMGKTSSRGSRMRRLFARNTAGPPLYDPSPTGQHAENRPEGSCTTDWRFPVPETILKHDGVVAVVVVVVVDVDSNRAPAGLLPAVQVQTTSNNLRHRYC